MRTRGKRLWLALTAVLCAALAAVLLAPRAFAVPPPSAALRAASEGLDDYDFSLVFDADAGTLAISMALSMQNRADDTLESVVLRLWAGAYQREDTSPAALEEIYDRSYAGGFSPADMTLHGVWWEDEPAPAAFADDAQTVLRVTVPPLAPGARGTLRLRMLLTIPDCASRLGRAGGVWALGNCLPVLARYENGAYREDAFCPIGDPFVADCANYRVTLSMPQGYLAAAPCLFSQGEDGLWRGEALAARDFALVISDSFHVARGMQGDTAVMAYAQDAQAAARMLDCAKRALETFSGLYGAYPFSLYTVCAVDFPYGGMEYAGLSFLSQTLLGAGWEDSLELAVAHETAHQWFYALVGSDSFREPWQDEALAEYATLRYVRARYGASAYETLLSERVHAPMRESIPDGATPGSPIDWFSSLAEYQSVVYGRGAALIVALDTLLPGGADAFLKAYCERFAFGFAARADFEALALTVCGVDITPLTSDYLDTYMIT